MSGEVREVNLERGMPRADQAIRQLTFGLCRSCSLGYGAVKLIHVYGPSGTGGRIRVESRKYLARLKARGEIAGFIPGEEFSIFQADTLAALRRCGGLRKDRDLERHNNGVTIVLL